MNTSSFLIVGAASIFGAAVIFLGMQYGMNASDEYASRLSVTSQEYLKQRAKAAAMGHDASKIKDNAARSQRPGEYDASLSGGLTSPYLRSDSDKAQLTSLVKARMKDETLGDKPKEDKDELEFDFKDLSADGVYTVHDEIRHQLATEEMSDEKRAMLQSLLPKKATNAIRAVNVILEFDTNNCVVPRNSNSLIGVMFRNESQAIRGSSLTELDELIAMRKRCDGKLLVEYHSGAVSDSDIELRENRRDEVKYYLLQRRVPAESIVIGSL